MPHRTSHTLWQYVSVVLILIGFTALVIPHINRAPLIDEIDTFVNFTDSWVKALFFYARPNNHLAHSLLVWISRTFIGDSLLALRFPAFAATLLSLALIYRFSKWLGGYKVGMLALLLMATTTIIADYAVNGRGYSMVNALTIVLVWQLLAIVPPFTRRDNYKLMATAFMLMLVMPATLPILFGATLWLGIALLKAWRRQQNNYGQYIKLIFSLLFGIGVALPFYSFAFLNLELYRTYVNNFGYFVPSSMLMELSRQVFSLSPITGIISILCIIGGIGFAMQARRWRWLQLLILFIVAAIIAGIVQFTLTGKVFYPRNYLYFVPLFAVLGGFIALRIPSRLLMIVAIVLVSVTILPMQRHLGADTTVNTVREMVYEHLTESDLLVVGCCYELQMLYYTKQDPTRLLDIMDYNEDKQSVVLLGTGHASVSNLIERYRLQEFNLITSLDSCAAINTPDWDNEQFVRCPIPNN